MSRAAAKTSAADAVHAARRTLAEWATRLDDATERLTEVEGVAGVDILDNPDRAEAIEDDLVRLRGRVSVAQKAVDAQRVRVVEAEAAFLRAEADSLDVRIVAMRESIEQHQGETQRLLEALERHEGPYVPASRLRMLPRSTEINVSDEPVPMAAPKSAAMLAELQRLERVQQALRMEASGEDTGRLIHYEWAVTEAEFWPPTVWGPTAVVPVASYRRLVEEARATVAELEALELDLPEQIASLEAELVVHTGEEREARADALERRLGRLIELQDGELDGARARLAALQDA